MVKILSFVLAILFLPLLILDPLHANAVRKVYREQPITGEEHVTARKGEGALLGAPPSSRLLAIGTVVDSTIYDYQANGAIGQRIVTLGDGSLHVMAMVSPDESPWNTRGMKYIYYAGGFFTNFGYIEGSGTGNQRAGFGAIVGYSYPGSPFGNIAITCSHTNLDGRAFGAHWYSFQDAFQGLGAFAPAEGDPGDGSNVCEAFLWPTLAIVNDETGNMAMTGLTGNQTCGTGGDDVGVVHKTFNDPQWGPNITLDTMNDPSQWSGPGPDVPMIAGDDTGYMVIVTSEFSTNIYYWESTDGGATWGARQDVTGFPIVPHVVPPDTSSDEYRPLQSVTVSMSPGGIPHVVWPAYQAQGVLPDSLFTPGTGLYQYRTKLEHWDPIHGITTIYRHSVGQADQVLMTTFTYNMGHPTIGFLGASDDSIYAVFEGYLDADRDPGTGIGYGDIYVSLSTDGGATWQDRVNITNSIGSDDLFPAIARFNPQGVVQELPGFSVGNPDGVNDFVMIYQNDDAAGTYLAGDEANANWDMLLVAPVDFDTRTGIGGGQNPGLPIPKAFALGQNYPNPFNPSTRISYQLPEEAQVSLKVHNLRGQVVRELVQGVKEAGSYSVQWNGRDEGGRTVSSGIYLYILETDKGYRSAKKMVVLK